METGMCGRKGRLKGRRKSGESFLDPVRFATMSGGPRTVLHEYNGREKSSIIRARSIHRREMTRERWKKDGEVASLGLWTMAYAHISPD